MPRKDRRKIICWANNTIDESQTKGDRLSHLRAFYHIFQLTIFGYPNKVHTYFHYWIENSFWLVHKKGAKLPIAP